jgi:predicted enzyme related to lactoylglutathione lyase
MITNEVAFIAIAVSDAERARKFYQETLELKPATTAMNGAWVESEIGATTIAQFRDPDGNKLVIHQRKKK